MKRNPIRLQQFIKLGPYKKCKNKRKFQLLKFRVPLENAYSRVCVRSVCSFWLSVFVFTVLDLLYDQFVSFIQLRYI